MAGLGLVGVTLNQVGYTVGLSLTSGSHGALIFATAPVWGLVLGIVLGLERGSWRSAMGLGLALAGVALVVGDGLGSPEASVGGDLLVCLSALSWGAYTVLSLSVLRTPRPAASRRLDHAARRPCGAPACPHRLSRSLRTPLLRGMGCCEHPILGRSLLLDGAGECFRHSSVASQRPRLGANRVLVYMYLVTLFGLVS